MHAPLVGVCMQDVDITCLAW